MKQNRKDGPPGPGAMHHWLEGEEVMHSIPRFHPYTAETLILSPRRPTGGLPEDRYLAGLVKSQLGKGMRPGIF